MKTNFFLIVILALIITSCAGTSNVTSDELLGDNKSKNLNAKSKPINLIPFTEDIIAAYKDGLDSIQCFLKDSLVLVRQRNVTVNKISKGIITEVDSTYVERVVLKPYPDPSSQGQIIGVVGKLYKISFSADDKFYLFFTIMDKKLKLASIPDGDSRYVFFGDEVSENKWWVRNSPIIYCGSEYKTGKKVTVYKVSGKKVNK